MGGERCDNGGGVIGVEYVRCGEGRLCLERGSCSDYYSCSGGNYDDVVTLLDSGDWAIGGSRPKVALQAESS